jgi:hypothetical protein
MINGRGRTIPMDIFRLVQATRAYLAVLDGAMPAVITMGGDAAFLRELMDAARDQKEWGTPASIAMALKDICDAD